MNKLYISICAMLAVFTADASDYQAALQEIVNRNLGLQTAKIEKEAVCQENLSGLNLSNPEVEFSYQWGSPEGVPDKKTVDVTQSFDFATLSNSRRRLAEGLNVEADREYNVKQQALAAEVDALMTQCVGLKRKLAWQESVVTLLKETEEDIRKGMEKGIFTRIDLNSARLMSRNAETDAALTNVELNTLLGQLTQLAGGSMPQWDGNSYLPYQLPADIESYAREFSLSAPEAALATAVADNKNREITLRKRENLPNFSLGYTAEMLRGDNHHGVAVGIELPLWAGSGKVKAAQAAQRAAELAKSEKIEILRLECVRLYNRATLLKAAFEDNKAIKEECDNTADLQKLLENGKISYANYRQSLIPLLEMEGRALDAEQAYQSALADFRQGSL